jgi:hypothetical protein
VTAQQLPPKPTKEGYDEPSLESPRLKLRASLAGYVSVAAATGWKSCRVAVPSLGPEASGLQAAPFSKLSESPAAF